MFALSFHHVEPDPLRHLSRKRWTITPDGLRRVIRLLRQLDIEIISLRDYWARPDFYLADRDKQRVLLTFDDGYENFYQHAFPIMQEEQCPATIFVLGGKLSGANDWDQRDVPENDRDKLLSAEQMLTMAASPWITYGSHGFLHRDFTALSEEALHTEIHQSHEVLSQLLGDAFFPALAYPWGRNSQAVHRLMEDSPYLYGFGTRKQHWEPHSPQYDIPRYDVYFQDGNPLFFLSKLFYHRLADWKALPKGFGIAALVKTPQHQPTSITSEVKC
jgi:peptidoglycan/xylan/chitin deacetylase (PgdA/CDA1 family)